MSVPSTPQDLINLIREKLYDNTSGKIEEDTLRSVLESIINVLDAKFSLFSPTLTEAQYSQWNLILDYMLRETKGVLTTSSTAPAEKGKYLLSGTGTYTNLGGLVASADKLNYAYFNGTSWSLISVQLPTITAQISLYNSTLSYASGSQVIYKDRILQVQDGKTASAGVLPIEGEIWKIILGAPKVFNLAVDKFGLPSHCIGTMTKSTSGSNKLFTLVGRGVSAAWQNYGVVYCTKEDMERAGADFTTGDVYVSMSFESEIVSIGRFVVRYGGNFNDLTLNTSTTGTDVSLNSSGIIEGLGTQSDFTGYTFSRNKIQKVNNFRIPAIYKGKALTGIMIMMTSNTQSMTDNTQVFTNPKIVIASSVADNYVYPELAPLQPYANVQEIYYAAIGDSITNANHTGVTDIDINDSYMPIDGYSLVSTYKRKCYAYYIAKKYNIRWANYGWGGTTISDVYSKGYNNARNPFVAAARLENLKTGIDWNYISLFFGWNDNAFGALHHREKWLSSTYGGTIGYPVNSSQIGASGFATQAQKDACDAVTGVVNGVNYTNNNDYFFAKFLGTIDSTDTDTWYGAWNTVISYLMKKYPKAKIMLFVPYINERGIDYYNSIVALSNKWGLTYFDFENLPYWYYRRSPNNTALANPNDVNGKWYTSNGTALNGTVNGYNQARFSTDTLHPTNLGYEKLAEPIGLKLFGS